MRDVFRTLKFDMTSAVQQTPAKRSASVFVTPSPSSRYYREAKDYSPTNEQSKKSTIYSRGISTAKSGCTLNVPIIAKGPDVSLVFSDRISYKNT